MAVATSRSLLLCCVGRTKNNELKRTLSASNKDIFKTPRQQQSNPVEDQITEYTLVPHPVSQTATAKMSISNEALQKIEAQSIAAQQQIGLVRTQQASKQREMRLAQLTRNELATLPETTAVYEGVGKMFVSVPVPALKDRLSTEMKEMETEVENLGKRGAKELGVVQGLEREQEGRLLLEAPMSLALTSFNRENVIEVLGNRNRCVVAICTLACQLNGTPLYAAVYSGTVPNLEALNKRLSDMGWG
nr:related to prefoldin subunit 1 [imported] - Neurospora crassa [Neurospora crassa]